MTLALLKELSTQADTIQRQLDTQQIATVDSSEDPRPKLKILRLLISAGLQTPERDHRHRRRPGSVKCKCGHGSPTIFHISWECSCYQQLRQPIWQYLPQTLESLPVCFQLTTIVSQDMNITKHQIKNIQSILFKIWQKQVQDWYDATDPEEEIPQNVDAQNSQPPPDQPPNNPPVAPSPTNNLSIKRGHVLRLIPSGGVFCCRCGRQTKYQKASALENS